jgi:hypothetical protein
MVMNFCMNALYLFRRSSEIPQYILASSSTGAALLLGRYKLSPLGVAKLG